MSRRTNLVVKLSGTRSEYLSDKLLTTNSARFTDITNRSKLPLGDKGAFTQAPSRTLEVIDAAGWAETLIMFKMDDSNERSLDELIRLQYATRLTTANLDHIVQLRLPDDFFESSLTRRVRLYIVPKSASMTIGRELTMTNPGSRDFQPYEENKKTIQLTTAWKAGQPLRTFPTMQREHKLFARVYETTPGSSLTSQTHATVGLARVAPESPVACPTGPMRSPYGGGCATDAPTVGARALATNEPHLKFSPMADLSQLMQAKRQPIPRDADAENYCIYDGK